MIDSSFVCSAVLCLAFIFFFKQKTAYELRISDWSSDVCSSDLRADFPIDPMAHGQRIELGEVVLEVRHTPGHTPESISVVVWEHGDDEEPWAVLTGEIGRASFRESVCQYV